MQGNVPNQRNRRRQWRDLEVTFRLEGGFGRHKIIVNVYNPDPLVRRPVAGEVVTWTVTTRGVATPFDGATDGLGRYIIDVNEIYEATVHVVAAGKEKEFARLPGSVHAAARVTRISEAQAARHRVPLTLAAERMRVGRAKYRWATGKSSQPIEPDGSEDQVASICGFWLALLGIGALALVLTALLFPGLTKYVLVPVVMMLVTAAIGTLILLIPGSVGWRQSVGTWAERFGADNNVRLVTALCLIACLMIIWMVFTVQTVVGQPVYDGDCVTPTEYSSKEEMAEDKAEGIEICPEQKSGAWFSPLIIVEVWCWLLVFAAGIVAYIPWALRDDVARQQELWRQHRAEVAAGRRTAQEVPEGLSPRVARSETGKWVAFALLADVATGLIARRT